MRLSTLAFLGSLILAVPAHAQTVYSRLASQNQLADMGQLPNVQPTCVIQIYGDFFFFDDTSDQIVRYNPDGAAGSRTTIVVSAADLDALAQTDVTQCRDSDGGPSVAVYALSNAANEDLLVTMLPDGQSRELLASGPSADGIAGIAVASTIGFGKLYVARSQFFGAPEDGVYQIQASGTNQSFTPVLTNPDLDLVGIDVASNGDVYATSSENGVGLYTNKIVRVTASQATPALQVVLDPFAGPSPLFVNGTDGGIEDLFIVEQGNVERMFVMNNSFGGPQGETIGRFNLDGSSPAVVFTQEALIASPAAMATAAAAYTTPGGTGYMTYDVNSFGQISNVYLASRGSNSGQTALFKLDVRSVVTADEQDAAETPGYALTLANPVRGSARVRIVQPAPGPVRLSALDVLGREVAVVAQGTRGSTSDATFDASALTPGVYHLVLRSATGSFTRSVTIVR